MVNGNEPLAVFDAWREPRSDLSLGRDKDIPPNAVALQDLVVGGMTKKFGNVANSTRSRRTLVRGAIILAKRMDPRVKPAGDTRCWVDVVGTCLLCGPQCFTDPTR